MDNLGINGFAGSENAITRIENERNNSGFFIIVFVPFLQEGGIHDSDVHVMKSLLDSIANSLRKRMTNKYGAILNKVSDECLSAVEEDKNFANSLDAHLFSKYKTYHVVSS